MEEFFRKLFLAFSALQCNESKVAEIRAFLFRLYDWQNTQSNHYSWASCPQETGKYSFNNTANTLILMFFDLVTFMQFSTIQVKENHI